MTFLLCGREFPEAIWETFYWKSRGICKRRLDNDVSEKLQYSVTVFCFSESAPTRQYNIAIDYCPSLAVDVFCSYTQFIIDSQFPNDSR